MMIMYKESFFIIENCGNNAFSFEKRKNPKLYVPSAIEGGIDDVRVGEEVVFEDFDENEVLQSCRGLKNLVRMRHPETGAPVIVVDNHNHVFWFWYEAWQKGLIQRGATLVHIDQHKDTRQPPRGMTHDEAGDLEKAFHYTNHVLNVGNYIPPAMEEGLIGALISVTSEEEMRKNPPAPQKTSLIVNVDLDFWAPELDYISTEEKARFTKEWMRQADLITVATSPFFIDQERAIATLKDLMLD